MSADQALILIVDDDPQLLRLLSLRLRSEGYEVMEAASGEEALTRLAAALPQLLITDMRMASGMTLLARPESMIRPLSRSSWCVVTARTGERMEKTKRSSAD